MIYKRFVTSEVWVCESTAKAAIGNPSENTWTQIEQFLEEGNYIPAYVFALPNNKFAIDLQHKYNLDLRTRDGHFVLQDFK